MQVQVEAAIRTLQEAVAATDVLMPHQRRGRVECPMRRTCVVLPKVAARILAASIVE